MNDRRTVTSLNQRLCGLIGLRILIYRKGYQSGAACVTRTRDPRITNAMLYQLS
jgi:hypothetical protein